MTYGAPFALAGLVVLGCSSPGGPADFDARSVDAAPPPCDANCLLGWWTRVNGECASFCAPPDAPTECAQSDCELLEARGFQSDGDFHTLFPITHSEASSSLTLLLPSQLRTWAMTEACVFMVDGMADPDTPACSPDELAFHGDVLAAASGAFEQALDRAAEAGPGPQPY